jgi:hypothetical protein
MPMGWFGFGVLQANQSKGNLEMRRAAEQIIGHEAETVTLLNTLSFNS